jgi:signal transduction histidine kinase
MLTPAGGGCETSLAPIDKIFTALFTTKSRGSGLGLATAKRLVEAHQGEFRGECPPAGGTAVTVQLPTLPA